jgi:hypothetical protein
MVFRLTNAALRSRKMGCEKVRRFWRVMPLKELAVRRFDPNGVDDRKLVEQLTGGGADRGGEARFVFHCERRDKPDVHALALAQCNGRSRPRERLTLT